MEMNLHDKVWVALTEAGEKTYEEYWKNLRIPTPPLKKTLGWSEFEMWNLMNIFGTQCYNQGHQQFEKNILRFTLPN